MVIVYNIRLRWCLAGTWGKDMEQNAREASPKPTVLVVNTFEKGLECAGAFDRDRLPFDTGGHAKIWALCSAFHWTVASNKSDELTFT